ncbi:hypothetical protein ABB37_06795 [Leptomonas pyrrhocoris]|uniref:Uncharacterized protein n=1 Tax=Leptomonas pyrrhocoris TaxID=157538 RepID=A0A0M9FXN4_LEPPY|nr:hypothetical protein ABB37_06795 [Leptomonas pyrrhocoris]XP_015656496.1 hypothetical protein ABB37_06795 [Leptomonas pyrrhocoris]KPA78056.1 hypothetical protein ABB37_06795 [Leptomonas pyrrhocoris]KPA78057.1 hypothetical protein ABB37_06795 [Leptomonas pyrrhocoris]|eukprot:XP_015656495.1 hypothetical protein ABB37_06795 [Leptomonas pyrrhocoris]
MSSNSSSLFSDASVHEPDPTDALAKESQEQERLDAQRVKAAEVAALNASAAANCAETEAALRRTTQEAHRALQTAHTVTAALATQDETIAAVETAMRESEREWHHGRKEMRRMRHWYVALAHWLRCGGSASFRSVAAKEDRKALVSNTHPMHSVAEKRGMRTDFTAVLKATADEPLHGEGALVGASRGAADRARSTDSTPVPDAAADTVGKCGHRRRGQGETTEVPSSSSPAAAARSTRLRGVLLENESTPSLTGQQQRADMELCDRIEPGIVEVRQLVKEMHEQALLHNEMLTAHIDRLDNANAQTERTTAKNVAVVQKR